MIDILNLVIYGLGWLMVLLIMYVVMFRVYYHHKDSGEWPWWLYVLAAVFLPLDVILNWTLMPIICVDLPQKWTITDRMQRYRGIELSDASSKLDFYHFYFSDSLCKILNLFDKEHC